MEPIVHRKLVNRIERLKKFVALDPIAPRPIIEKEIELIDRAREEWLTLHQRLCALLVVAHNKVRCPACASNNCFTQRMIDKTIEEA